MSLKEEDIILIDKLFTHIEEKIEKREGSIKLSKGARIRHKNGRMLDVFLLYLTKNFATISFVDVKTKVEVSTVDIHNKDLQCLNLTYEKASKIYDEIIKSSIVIEANLKNKK